MPLPIFVLMPVNQTMVVSIAESPQWMELSDRSGETAAANLFR